MVNSVQVTHDVSHLTCADFLRAPGVQTPVIVRFSTVIHERGSPETLRDPRGFAVKFYTREGNWDLVCLPAGLTRWTLPLPFFSMLLVTSRSRSPGHFDFRCRGRSGKR